MLRRVFSWYGGKLRMVHMLRWLIPEHKKYVEPFMGSMALLLNHSHSMEEIACDLDAELVNLMQILADGEKGKELIGRLCELEYSKETFDKALACKKQSFVGLDDMEKAVAKYILISQSVNSLQKSFSRRDSFTTLKYRRKIMLHLPEVCKRLEGVKILHKDGIDLLAEVVDDSETFAFVDPPYCHSLRGKGANKAYACELSQEDHVRLLETIRDARCKIILCGYRGGDCFYDDYLMPCGWHCYKLCDVVKSCQITKKKRAIAEEFIWVNYELPDCAKYKISLREYGLE